MTANISRAAFVAIAVLSAFAAGAADQNAKPAQAAAPPSGMVEKATFAAGCFWCTESDFDEVKGVLKTTSGFMGGKTKSPTYEQVSTGSTGHAEAVEIEFDPKVVTYKELLDVYWHHVDFTDGRGQFCDRGSQYRPAIFTYSDEQKKLAEESKAMLAAKFKQPVAVEIVPASEFTAANEHHQNYHVTNAIRYKIYRHGCGRDARIQSLWARIAPIRP